MEPGFPSRSLLYQALASPRVQEAPEIPTLEDFPTLAEIDVVENYVFAAGRLTLQDLRAGGELAVVVCAYENRPASHTCHKRHAHLVFARTGVSRVGDREGEAGMSRVRATPAPCLDFGARTPVWMPAWCVCQASGRMPGMPRRVDSRNRSAKSACANSVDGSV